MLLLCVKVYSEIFFLKASQQQGGKFWSKGCIRQRDQWHICASCDESLSSGAHVRCDMHWVTEYI